MAIKGSGVANPNAIRVMSLILVLTDSIRPLDRPCDRGQDRFLVFHDPALQFHERVDPAAAGPANPLVQGRGCFGRVEAEDGAEPFLQQVGPVQPRVGLGDPGEFGLAAGRSGSPGSPGCS